MIDQKLKWERDPNGAGQTGRVDRQWLVYVLNNGTWTVFKSGNYKAFAVGTSASVMSAKGAAQRAIDEASND